MMAEENMALASSSLFRNNLSNLSKRAASAAAAGEKDALTARRRDLKEMRKQRVRESKVKILQTYYLNEENKLKFDSKF
jgi:hypothetical protein